MNANRRLEEFILKLSTKQNEVGHFDKVNELKQYLDRKKLQFTKDNIDNTDCTKQSCIANNK